MQLEANLAEYTNTLGMVECTTTSKTSELELKNMFYRIDFALILGKNTGLHAKVHGKESTTTFCNIPTLRSVTKDKNLP